MTIEVKGAGIALTSRRGLDPEIRQAGRHRIARRVIEAMIDEALTHAGVRSEQRARIYAVRDDLLNAIGDFLNAGDLLPRAIEAELRKQVQQRFADAPAADVWPEHRSLAELIARSTQEGRAVLTPSQRQMIGDYVQRNLLGRFLS